MTPFKLEANNPWLVGGILVVIGVGILFLQSFQSPKSGSASDTLLPGIGALDKAGLVKAPELTGIDGYINTEPGLKIADLKGKVVLVDFWTYSCINCIRTLPYLTAWDEKYRDKGLVIIGVHSPEFEFEKNYDNVLAAVQKYGIEYPVVQDNDFATWRAYSNRFWPHKFLIDAEGYIRYDHIGEGGYEETEQKIIELLMEKDSQLDLNLDTNGTEIQDGYRQDTTPELYLGYNYRRRPIGNQVVNGIIVPIIPESKGTYTLPDNRADNTVYLEGEWEDKSDFVRLISDTGKVALNFTAREVNIVAGASPGSTLSVELDNQPLPETIAGDHVTYSGGTPQVTVDEHKLYNLVQSEEYLTEPLVLDVNGPGFELYTFTFG